jgi:hypothetical protein
MVKKRASKYVSTYLPPEHAIDFWRNGIGGRKRRRWSLGSAGKGDGVREACWNGGADGGSQL